MYLICSITFNVDQVRIEPLHTHVTIDPIRQTHDAVKLLWVCRHYSRHAGWPVVPFRVFFHFI